MTNADTEAEIADASCDFEGCGAGQGDPCALGLTFADCEHYNPGSQPANDETRDDLELSSGAGLTSTQALAITQRRRAEVVLLVGSPDSGKTTLLTRIYHQFHTGPYEGYRFGGSATLLGLEERCHLARVASELDAPDTPHTPFPTLEAFFHLRLQGSDEVAPRELLIGDVSGEHFKRVLSNSEECADIVGIRRADHLTLLVDGRLMTRLDERNLERSRCRLLIRSLGESQLLRPDMALEVVMSKTDRINAEGADAKAFATETLDELAEMATTWFPEVRPPVLSASRTVDPEATPAGTGVGKVLRNWMDSSARSLEHESVSETVLISRRSFHNVRVAQ